MEEDGRVAEILEALGIPLEDIGKVRYGGDHVLCLLGVGGAVAQWFASTLLLMMTSLPPILQ